MFALELAREMAAGRKIVYFDESRFDNWSLQKKSWAAKYSNNYVVKNSKMYSCTVYGAIG